MADEKDPKTPQNTAGAEAPASEQAKAQEEAPKEKKKEKPLSETERLAAEVAKLKESLADAESKLLYLQADYQNYRRRTLKDISDARVRGTASALEPFLSINDFLAMAQQASEQSDNVAAIKQGILMIIGEYRKAMDELGVSRIQTVGKKFDPAFCEAVTGEPSDTVPENTVIREFSGGYKMGERILRAARVVVSTGRPKPEAEKEEKPAATETPADAKPADEVSGKEA